MIRTKYRGKQKRHRNVAHLWADKQVIRFFRKNFDKKDYKNLRTIYLALCEIDSDFGEHHQIGGFTKTVSTYAGVSIETASTYLRKLVELGFIFYTQQKENGRFGNTTLTMYRYQENPSTEKPVNGKTDVYKNPKGNKNKNPKGNKNKSKFFKFFPPEWKQDNNFRKAFNSYLRHREQKGRVTEEAIRRAAIKLRRHPIVVATTALNLSVENGWTGVFPESIKAPPVQDPQEIITAHFPTATARRWIKYCLTPALALLPKGSTNEDETMVADGLCKIADMFARKQERPKDGGSQWDLIPDALTAVEQYTDWLGEQGWIDTIQRTNFRPNNRLFRVFIDRKQKEIGFNIFTGRSL